MTVTLVIGLDAATWRVIDPMLEDGELPNIATLVKDGVRGPLSSTVPPMTPLAWTSMATGVNPGRHGIFDFLDQDPETHEIAPVDFSKMDTPAIWDVFASEDRTAGFVNFPLAHPPRQIDPFFVGGIPAHAKQTVAYPEDVQRYLDEIGYDVHPHVDPEVHLEGFYRAVRKLTETQLEATLELADRYDPELLWTVFMGLDWVQHHLWEETVDGEPAVPAFYRFIDDAVGELVELVDGDGTVCLVSDHGARPVEGVVHINSLLEKLGYLQQREEDSSIGERVRDSVMNTAWSIGEQLPPGLKRLAKRYAPSEMQDEIRAAAGVGQRGMADRIDWPNTEAFSYGYMGRIFLNSEARFENGVVPSEQVSDLRASLAAALSDVVHPETGGPMFESVKTREELYEGSYMAQAADLVAIPTDWEYSMFGDFSDEWVHPPGSRSADHDEAGVFVLSGPSVKPGEATVDVTDIAPTMLHLCGLPVVEGMDGDTRTDLLTDEARSARSVSTVADVPVSVASESYSPEEQHEVEERLEDLGYM